MGIITINILEKINNPIDIPNGKLGVIPGADNTCTATWTVVAKTTSSAWVEWVTLGGPIVNVSRDGWVTLNVEQIASNASYSVTVEGFKSPDDNNNDFLAQVNFVMKDIEGGSVLDTQTVSRMNTDITC